MKQVLLHSKPGFAQDGLQETAGCRESVLKTVAYFDIFHYPLDRNEIGRFLDRKVSDELLDDCLQRLQVDNRLFLHNGFYSLQNNHLLSHRRMQGNKRAEKMLVKAGKIGRFLYQFPFVRAVGVSGSLSKNFAGEGSDIDFFIITRANRLWIARTLMQVLTKLALLRGRQHFYCMNYYIDEEAMQLAEKNIFTAIELKTLLPVAGEPVMQKFFAANSWTNDWLPVCEFRKQATADSRSCWLKRLSEWVFGASWFNKTDEYLFRNTTLRWQRKEKRGMKNGKGDTLNLLTGKHFARTNPGAFQEKVLAVYEKKIASLRL
jgi:hypothetical protein